MSKEDTSWLDRFYEDFAEAQGMLAVAITLNKISKEDANATHARLKAEAKDILQSHIDKQLVKAIELKMYELSRMKIADMIEEITRLGNRKYNREAQRKHRSNFQTKSRKG